MPYYLNMPLSYHLEYECGRPLRQVSGAGISCGLSASGNRIPVCGHTSPWAWEMPPAVVWLRPSKARGRTTSVPKFSKVESFPGGCGHLEGDFPGMAYHFGSNVNHPSSQSSDIGGDLHHRGAHIFFERLVEEECNKLYKVPLIPLHVAVLSMLGCPLQELLNLDKLSEDCAKDGVYEFLYVWPPLNFWNATGGLISPVAIK